MTVVQSIRISECGALSIDAAFLRMGFVGDGLADGPYPGMYEHWSSGHPYGSSELPGKLEQTAFWGENSP